MIPSISGSRIRRGCSSKLIWVNRLWRSAVKCSRAVGLGLMRGSRRLERWMKASVVTIEPNGHFCSDCAVRDFAVCSSLDPAELREFEHLGRRVRFGSGETVFSEEDITSSFYNLLEGVMRLYKLLPDGRRQIVGFALPGDFLGMNLSGRHNFSAD